MWFDVQPRGWPDTAALDAALDAASDPAWDAGLRVLQGIRLGATDEVHVAALVDSMDPPPHAHLLDIGCGFGEVARLARGIWPDLRFTLLNRNAAQLRRCPSGPGLRRVRGDAHAIPFTDASFDGALLLYTLCHLDVPRALAEARRVVRPGGLLFVLDYEALDGPLASAELFSAWHPRERLMEWAEGAGWRRQTMHDPGGDDATFRALFASDDAYEGIFGTLRPIAWRAVRE